MVWVSLVNKAVLKKGYLIFSLVLSLYLLVVTILGFTPLRDEAFMKPLNTISVYVLCYFVLELIVLFFMADNLKTYLKEQWISIIAVLSSLSVTTLIDGVIAVGSLTGLKALKGVKGLKALKAMKSMKGLKLLKATKNAKVAKTVKIAKKTRKVFEHPDEYASDMK
jgi:hypothetical protein